VCRPAHAPKCAFLTRAFRASSAELPAGTTLPASRTSPRLAELNVMRAVFHQQDGGALFADVLKRAEQLLHQSQAARQQATD